jgi:putative ABC transport system substrate-binding protein
MRRRDFVAFLGGAAAWMPSARGQERLRVVGYLGSSDAWPGELAAVYQGLRETGFVEGKNVSIEFRYAEGHYDRLPSLSAELVGRNVAVIWAVCPHVMPQAPIVS